MASTYISLPSSSVSGSVSVDLNAIDDSVSIGDGVNTLAVNPDGSINVNIGGNIINEYAEITDVASSISFTTILSYIPGSSAKLKLVTASGTNIAEYIVTINSNMQGKRYTVFGGNLNTDFDFRDGIDLLAGDMVNLQVRHNRSNLGNFNGNIIIQI